MSANSLLMPRALAPQYSISFCIDRPLAGRGAAARRGTVLAAAVAVRLATDVVPGTAACAGRGPAMPAVSVRPSRAAERGRRRTHAEAMGFSLPKGRCLPSVGTGPRAVNAAFGGPAQNGPPYADGGSPRGSRPR